MSVLSENVVLSRTRCHDLNNVKKLNCWGAEISDVSIVKKMPNVEVLSLSLNKISSLKEFSECKYLKELYLRSNQISNINEIGYIQDLPNLKILSLQDNPCVQHANYRLTILRALPNLELLDNVSVTPEEVSKAQTLGDEIVDVEYCEKLQQKPDLEYEEYEEDEVDYSKEDMVYFEKVQKEFVSRQNSAVEKQSPSNDSSLPRPNLKHSNKKCNLQNINNFSPNAKDSNQRSSILSATSNILSISDYSIYNGSNCNHRNSENRNNCNELSCESNSLFHSNESHGECFSPASSSSRKFGFSSQQQKGLSKGGKYRNANILSAILCLVKELDFASLEVVETAIHCRMEEFED